MQFLKPIFTEDFFLNTHLSLENLVAQNKMLLGISVERDESSIKSIAGKK